MWKKIHVTRQFFEANGRHGDLIEKQKTSFCIRSMGVCVPNIRSVSFFDRPGNVTQINTYTNTHIHKYKSEIRNIFDRLFASRGF